MEQLKVALVNYQMALKKANGNTGVADVRYWEGYIEAWKRHLRLAGASQSDFDSVAERARLQVS